ncbi:FAD/NAD(P)-binding protein [Frankia sp. R43]|uniref:FAD/NAD(P)-binding protein n=1 Tax=Frankia sp. R43 TaxID=269536 RepID=UPI00137ADE06|nr:FAD/NAD(P)-binding protein [Frankia sp. R43]
MSRSAGGTVATRRRARLLRTMDIGIVGAGAAAVCLLDALSQADSPVGRVTVFDPVARPWRGRPYATDVPAARVNAVPREMSIRHGDPDHFARWLRQSGHLVAPDPWTGTPFVARAVYGDYLADSAAAAIARLRERGWQVALERTVVTAAVLADERVVLRTAKGRHHAADYTVLCVGVGRPHDSYALRGRPGFVADPYPLARSLPAIHPEAHVAVLGSGLTAVDTVLGLTAQGHQGPISLVSRHGVLPAVRQRPVDVELRHFTPERLRAWARRGDPVPLARLVDLMRRELADGGHDEPRLAEEIFDLGRQGPVDRLRRQLTEVDDPDLGLRVLQRAVPETGPDVWPLLSAADRTHILTHHYRALMSLCCPMPPSTAVTLLALADAGQLRVRSGLHGVRQRAGGGFTLATAHEDLSCDTLVNAVSPPAHRIPVQARALVASLVAAGAAAAHPHGGLAVERATSRLTVEGRPSTRLHALGDLAAGSLFFTFGIPSLVDRGADITQAMITHAELADRASPRVLALR